MAATKFRGSAGFPASPTGAKRCGGAGGGNGGINIGLENNQQGGAGGGNQVPGVGGLPGIPNGGNNNGGGAGGGNGGINIGLENNAARRRRRWKRLTPAGETRTPVDGIHRMPRRTPRRCFRVVRLPGRRCGGAHYHEVTGHPMRERWWPSDADGAVAQDRDRAGSAQRRSRHGADSGCADKTRHRRSSRCSKNAD